MDEASADNGYTADQIASAYGLDNLYAQGALGAGVTVAIYELEPFSSSDIKAYQKCYGTTASITTTNVDGGPGTTTQQGEAALDIEDVIGLAPQASINVFQGPNNTQKGGFDTYEQIISNPVTPEVISTSWGMCESNNLSNDQAENTLFEEAAAQGQTIFAASGDTGADACGQRERKSVV